MKLTKLLPLGLLLIVVGGVLGGCSMQTQKDSSIPWAQPSSWENTLPGMSGPAGH